jgi:hypothetical protein
MSSPDEIRAQIDETREELSDDLSTLQGRLDPSQKAVDLLDRVAVSTRERPWQMGRSHLHRGVGQRLGGIEAVTAVTALTGSS